MKIHISLLFYALSGITLYASTNKEASFLLPSIDKKLLIEAEQAQRLIGDVGILKDATASGGRYLGNFKNGSRAEFDIELEESGLHEIILYAASVNPEGDKVLMSIGDLSPQSLDIPYSGAWQAYKPIRARVMLSAGKHTLSLTNPAKAWNLDRVELRVLEKKQKFNTAIFAFEIADSGQKDLATDASLDTTWQMDKTKGDLTLRYRRFYCIDSIKIANAPHTQIQEAELLFSDGSKIDIGEVPKEGLSLNFEEKKLSWVTLRIKKATRCAVAEIEIFGKQAEDTTEDVALTGYMLADGKWIAIAQRGKATQFFGDELKIRWYKKQMVSQINLLALPFAQGKELTGSLLVDGKSIQQWKAQTDANGMLSIKLDKSCAMDNVHIVIDQWAKEDKHPLSLIQVLGKGEAAQIPLPVKEVEMTKHHYHISGETISGTAGFARAIVSNRIDATHPGEKTKTWKLHRDISHAPLLSAPNDAMLEAVYNMAQEELVENIMQSKFGDVFSTGTIWSAVWTRDTAMSVNYSLAWLYPQESLNSLWCKVTGDKSSPFGNTEVFIQDTGTGGSYPTSVDRIIMGIAGWDIYVATGDKSFLEKLYTIMENTITQDYHVNYDKDYGLFNGETGGLDHRSKTYPDWMGHDQDHEAMIHVAEGKSSIVNIVYAKAMDILSESAFILAKDAKIVQLWKSRSELIKQKVNKYFWMQDRGLYASFLYPSYMGAPRADKLDVISNGYALMFDIADAAQKKSITENYPIVTYGAPTVWPQKTGALFSHVYHNRGVWPGWESSLMIGAKECGNLLLADELWRSQIRSAAMSLSNKEVIDYATGEGLESDNQLWSIAGNLAGYYRILFGMTYALDGIRFKPFIPSWLNGPFELNNYSYRKAKLRLSLSGKGDQLISLKVNGEEKALDYLLPADATGNYHIEMILANSENSLGKVNKTPLSWVICPELPVLKQMEDGSLAWQADERYRYQLWNGTQYIDVGKKTSYTPPRGEYAVYSLVAIDSDGVSSELSQPIKINNPQHSIKVEAEDAQYKKENFAQSIKGYSGKGYVNDDKGNSANITWTIDVPRTGQYLFSVNYHNKGQAYTDVSGVIRSLYVDGEDKATLLFPLYNANHPNHMGRSSYIKLQLTKGKHTFNVKYDQNNWYDRNMSHTESYGRDKVSYDYCTLEYVGDSTNKD